MLILKVSDIPVQDMLGISSKLKNNKMIFN